MRARLRATAVAALAAVVFLLLGGACAGGEPVGAGPTPAGQPVALIGAGATYPEPLYTKAFYEYTLHHANVTVVYQPVGSGMGIARFTAGQIDFGASDVPMTAAEVAGAGGPSQVLQVPGALGAIAIAFNVPGLSSLRLDGPTLADIFMGKIASWSDPALAALNPDLALPNLPIVTAHRSDSSGTTYHFTSYLSLVSPAWSAGLGAGKTAAWPTGLAGNGNDSVGSLIRATPGSIGYVELAYAMNGGLSVAALKNQSGRYVQASVTGAQAAAHVGGAGLSPTQFSILNEPGDASYPISAFSWLLIRPIGGDDNKRAAVHDLVLWLIADGQTFAPALGYAPLPDTARRFAESQLRLMKRS